MLGFIVAFILEEITVRVLPETYTTPKAIGPARRTLWSENTWEVSSITWSKKSTGPANPANRTFGRSGIGKNLSFLF